MTLCMNYNKTWGKDVMIKLVKHIIMSVFFFAGKMVQESLHCIHLLRANGMLIRGLHHCQPRGWSRLNLRTFQG